MKGFFCLFLCLLTSVTWGEWYLSDQCVDDNEPVSRTDNLPKTHIAFASDDYLTGYIQSLVDTHYYEFRVIVIVRDQWAYVFNIPHNDLLRNSILCFIADVPCIAGVEAVCGCPEDFFCDDVCLPPLPCCQVRGIWFPQSTVIFQPFIADPRQVTNGGSIRFNDNAIGKHVGACQFGDIFPFFRWRDVWCWRGNLEVGLEAGIFAVFDLDHPSAALVNTDFFVAGRLAYAFDRWSFRFRLWHMSSHLGDEFILSYPEVDRKNVSDNGIDYFASFQLNKTIRIYGGIGYIFQRDKSFPEDPVYLEYGTEIKVFGCRDIYNKLHIQPFLAMHFRNWEEHDFNLDATYALGIEYGKIQGIGRKLRFFGEYHEGYSREGQFVRKRTNYYGIRLTYGF